ncbi:MAG: hypothetical protein AAF447_10620 [Myxococcota bacterium]
MDRSYQCCTASLLTALLPAILGTACSGSTGTAARTSRASRPAPRPRPAPFPSKAETLSFASQFATDRGLPAEHGEVPFPWALDGIPASPGPAEAPRDGSAGAMLDRVLATHAALTATAGMQCVSQAMATAALRSDGERPESAFERFALARCGAGTRSVGVLAVRSRGTPASRRLSQATQNALLESLEESLAELGNSVIGLAQAREGRDTVTVVAYASPTARLETPRPVADTAGTVAVRGELMEPGMKQVAALINQGATGYARCTLSSAVPLPRFWMECPLHATDDAARISIFAQRGNAPIAFHVVDVVGRRDPASEPRSESYDPALPELRPVSTPAALLAGVQERVAQIRDADGLAPVTVARAESTRLDGLVPAALSGGLTTQQQLTLSRGILAAWDVESPRPIRDGYYATTTAFGPPDAERWMATALLDPSLRRTFFDPSAAIVALGSTVEERGVAAIAASWRLHGDRVTEEAGAEALLQNLEQARQARGVPPPQLITDFDDLGAALEDVRTGRQSMDAAMESLLETASQRWQRSVYSYALETTNLSSVELPDALLEGGELMLSVGVTHQPLADSPWGTYLVGIIFTR